MGEATRLPVSRSVRRAGAHWRVLVHEILGRGQSGVAHHVSHSRDFGGRHDNSEWCRTVELPGTEFDELVVGRWLHVEQMGTGRWWMNVGGVTVWVDADRDGRPKTVTVYGPDDYAEPVDGVTYQCEWSFITTPPEVKTDGT